MDWPGSTSGFSGALNGVLQQRPEPAIFGTATTSGQHSMFRSPSRTTPGRIESMNAKSAPLQGFQSHPWFGQSVVGFFDLAEQPMEMLQQEEDL